MSKTIKWVIAILVIVLIVAGIWYYQESKKVSISDNDIKTETIKIGALLPLTGGAASWGESSQRGAQMAIDDINKAGGINGQQVELISQDHACDPKTALSAYQQSLLQTKTFISSSCSGTVLSIAPNLEKDNALLLATVVGSVKISSASPYLFRNWTVETNQADLIGAKIKELGYKKIGILNEQTDFGKGLATGVQNYLKNSGIEIITDSFAPGAIDVRTQLTKLKSQKIEALFFAPQTDTSSEVVLSQMEELNFKPKLFVNDIVLGAPKLLSQHPALLEGAIGCNFISQSDKMQNFLDTYKNRFGSEIAHATAGAVAYDSIMMLTEAIKANGDTNQGIASYLNNINYQGVSGNNSFNSKNDRSEVGYILNTVKNSQVIF